MASTFFLYTILAAMTVVQGNRGIMKDKRGLRNSNILLVCIILAFFAAFRGSTGTDSVAYKLIYENPQLYFTRTDVEIGFKILMFICNAIGLSYRSLFFIMNFMTSYFVFDAIYEERESLNIKVSLLVYVLDFYLFSYNIMRQMLAISLFLWAYTKWNHGKRISVMVALVAAILFHRVSIICLIIFCGRLFVQSKHYKMFIALFSGITLYIVLNRSLFVKLIGLLTNQNKHYLLFASKDLATSGGTLGFVIKILPILLLSIFSLHRTKNNLDYRLYFAVMILGYVLSLAGEYTSSQIERIGYYFAYCRIFMLGFITNGEIRVKRLSFGQNQIAVIVSIYLFIVYIYNFYIAGACEVVPYKFG